MNHNLHFKISFANLNFAFKLINQHYSVFHEALHNQYFIDWWVLWWIPQRWRSQPAPLITRLSKHQGPIYSVYYAGQDTCTLFGARIPATLCMAFECIKIQCVLSGWMTSVSILQAKCLFVCIILPECFANCRWRHDIYCAHAHVILDSDIYGIHQFSHGRSYDWLCFYIYICILFILSYSIYVYIYMHYFIRVIHI